MDLLDWVPPPTDRYGSTYSSALDYDRLNRQQALVWNVMKDGAWHTLREISEITQQPEASISARLREYRSRFGLKVDRQRRAESGTHEYRVRA